MERKRAIEILRKEYDPRGCDETLRKALETLIPELRESEDERIRAVILKLVLGMRDEIFTTADKLVTKSKVLAYLEKQKGKMTAEEFESSELFQLKLKTKYANGYQDGLAQKEQKPLSPDEKMNHPLYLEGFDVGREVGKVEAEQKPAEWSEEDEEMRNLIVAIFEVNHPDGFFKANELGTTDMRGVHTEEIISWLKSLRPSWKPSEEQMGALYDSIEWEEERAEDVDFILKSLYNDLKKLM